MPIAAEHVTCDKRGKTCKERQARENDPRFVLNFTSDINISSMSKCFPELCPKENSTSHTKRSGVIRPLFVQLRSNTSKISENVVIATTLLGNLRKYSEIFGTTLLGNLQYHFSHVYSEIFEVPCSDWTMFKTNRKSSPNSYED